LILEELLGLTKKSFLKEDDKEMDQRMNEMKRKEV